MFDLALFGGIARWFPFLYFALAGSVIYFAVKNSKDLKSKILWGSVAVAVFGYLPAKELIAQHKRDTYEKEAWAYFKKKCETEAGEKIYKTYTGVKSVLVVKPLPPATEKDLYDQYWYGDPYSDANIYKRSESSAIRLVSDWKHRSGKGTQKGLDFVEFKNESGDGFTRVHRPVSNDRRALRESIQKPVSEYGIAWEDISTPQDRNYWVASSRLKVIDLATNSTVAERIGFLIEAGFGSTAGHRRPWQTSRGIGPNGRSCPETHDATDQWFITSVFKQDERK